MFNRIIVPLDGSELAECVLPHVENIVRESEGEGPEVTFLYVIKRSELDYFDFTFEGRKRGVKYLDEKVRTARDRGINARYEILVGNPAEVISDYAARTGADRIIMATHGRSGISRWAYGSVAEKVMSSSSVPVSMIQASDTVPGIKSWKETAPPIRLNKLRFLKKCR